MIVRILLEKVIFGYGMETSDDTTPFYMEVTTIDSEETQEDSFEISYPLEFLIALAKTAITNLEEYLRRNKLNPDRHIRFGTYFFDQRNKSQI